MENNQRVSSSFCLKIRPQTIKFVSLQHYFVHHLNKFNVDLCPCAVGIDDGEDSSVVVNAICNVICFNLLKICGVVNNWLAPKIVNYGGEF